MSRKITIAGGSGHIGSSIVDELLKYKDEFEVVVLSRQEKKDLADRGATVITVDYENVEQLTNAVKGSYAVLSMFNPVDKPLALRLNSNLLQATKQAGVKKFIPSEWGTDTTKPCAGYYYESKYEFRKQVEESGLEYTFIGVGLFTEIFNYPFLLDAQNKKATIIDGDLPISIIVTEDIGKVAVAVLRYSYEHKWPTHINVSGEHTTWKKVIETAEKVLGEKFQVEYTTVSKIEEEAAQLTDPMFKSFKFLTIAMLNGKWAVEPSKEAAEIFKGTTFQTFEDYYRKTYVK